MKGVWRPPATALGLKADASLEAIDVRDAATGLTTRHSGGLFIVIGADAETAWLPSESSPSFRFGFLEALGTGL